MPLEEIKKYLYQYETDQAFQMLRDQEQVIERKIDPLDLRITLNSLYDRYQKPLFIVENGLDVSDVLVNGTVEDDYRIDYLREHIAAMKAAVNEAGVEIIGHTTWGCIDLVRVLKRHPLTGIRK